jgi:ornithine carbamoyltransferase
MTKDFISILDITGDELTSILSDAIHLKKLRAKGTPHEVLRGKSLAMIFEKSSTRTHISFEVGMHDLGGHALFLSTRDLQIGRGEEIRDTARVASRYVSAVMIRAYKHSMIEEFARFATIPVINGLSDREHPCQLLADFMTIREHFGRLGGLRVAWIGDGNNVCNSLVLSSALTGMDISVASPRGYGPKREIVHYAKEIGGTIRLTRSPEDAARDADVIVTDTWISMGDEKERDERLRAFKGFTVDGHILKLASPGARVLHCLPAHRNEEISDEVIDGSQSLVWEEAENRLHAQKALLLSLLNKRDAIYKKIRMI